MCGQKALNLQPGYSEAIVLLGCADYTSGNYRKAVRNFEKLASDDKNAGFSWLMQARCYEQLGQKDKAERAYKKAMEINPESELGDFLVKEKDTGNV
jgi:Tfp pilus assembly protein PilF